jgi:nucleoside-diphosphate-sugar epimerase
VKSVLVTGSTGFIGRHLVDLLKQKNCQVLETGGSAAIDLCDPCQVKSIPDTDIIVHLAARSFVPDSFSEPEKFYRNNFLSTLNLLELARKNNSRFVFFSTYVYGVPVYLPIDEEHPVAPLNPYTQSKVIGEQLCSSFQRDFNLPVTVFRPFNVYGPGQNASFLIPRIASQLKMEKIYLGDPSPLRDFVFVDDVVEAVYCSIQQDTTELQTFNLGSGTSISVGELVQSMKLIAGSASEIHFSNIVRQGEIKETLADITKVKKVLGWSPKTSLDEGLLRTLQA